MQRKKIQEAMKNVYFQKMTANGYHEIEEQIATKDLHLSDNAYTKALIEKQLSF